MEIKNGVGFKDGLAYIRSPKRDLENNRAVRVISLSTGDLFSMWERDNSPHVTEFLNLVEPKQLPTKDGSVIKNVVLGDDLGNCTIPYAMRVDGQWVGRCSCDIVAEPAEQYITDWEEV